MWCASMASVCATRLSADCCALARVDGGFAGVAPWLVKSKCLRVDAASHRAMLIVGRFLTGRRARQRTACLGTSGLALLSNASILNRFLAVILIASARQRRVNYTLPWSRVARVISG